MEPMDMCLLAKVDTRFVAMPSVTVLEKRCVDLRDIHIPRIISTILLN